MILDLELSAHFRAFDWEKVKTFYYVAKIGSFMGTGRFINLTQSAITRQIAELETHLGMPLFTRHKDGVRLTRKGEELLRIIEPTFQELVGFTRKTHVETSTGKKRKIRIAATHAVISYILGEHLISYNHQHPHLVFEIITDDQILDITLNDVDIAIRPYDEHTQGIEQDFFITLEKKLFASPLYLEKYGEPKNIEELIHHHFIAHSHSNKYPYSNLDWILKIGMPKGEKRSAIFSTTSLENAFLAAERGLGIIGSYDTMTLIKNSNLRNILPKVKDQPIKDYFIYPTYLSEDKEIISLKNYLYKKVNST